MEMTPLVSRPFLKDPKVSRSPHRGATARALALFFSGFFLLNFLGTLRTPHFDGSHWWIQLWGLPSSLSHGFLLLTAAFLGAYGLVPRMSRWRRGLTVGLTGFLLLFCLLNAAGFYLLLLRHRLHSDFPLPLSLLLGAGLFLLLLQERSSQAPAQRGNGPGLLAGLLLFPILFPLLQMICFGKTDYRRPADAAVVFGARAYANGTPSDALADRVRTGCDLYRAGLVGKLVFSGGPGDGAIHETEAMRGMALSLGVADCDIVLDPAGLNTRATVTSTATLFAGHHFHKILAVSHAYHLPRVKMAYERAGLEVFTVPARESYLLGQMPRLMAREVAAWWMYYIRPLAGPTQA